MTLLGPGQQTPFFDSSFHWRLGYNEALEQLCPNRGPHAAQSKVLSGQV